MPLSKSRHDSDDDPAPTPLRRALVAAYHVAQERIISNPNDAIGVMLFGTEHSDDPLNPGCSMLIDLDIPDVKGMKHLKEVLEYEDSFEEIAKPATAPPTIRDVFFYAGHKFFSAKENYTYRRLFLMTNTDLPPANSKQDRSAARTRASDLFETGIQIEPFFLSSPPDLIFDPSKFYEDVLFMSSLNTSDVINEKHMMNEISEESMQPLLTSDRIILESNLKARQVPQRATISMPMEIVSQGKLVIGVKLYILYKQFKIFSRAESLYMCDDGISRVVRSKRKPVGSSFDEDDESDSDRAATADSKSKEEEKSGESAIKKGYLFGEQIIPFTSEELRELRSLNIKGDISKRTALSSSDY